ncbi:MAG TPA: alpha/beta hydrolase [Nocardioidaceae bacterium]|nr:alpha/beta hydrolase [Nocardioidaceae bacterium]
MSAPHPSRSPCCRRPSDPPRADHRSWSDPRRLSRVRGVYRGPFALPDDSPTALVIGTTYDPASPYEGARALVGELGNAKLLTLVGDGHGAYGGESACIDDAVDHYLLTGALPTRTRCHPLR